MGKGYVEWLVSAMETQVSTPCRIRNSSKLKESLHDCAARVLLLGLDYVRLMLWVFRLAVTYLSIKHLALRAESLALLNQVVNFLSPLQHALDGVVQYHLGLVELPLDLHGGVGIFWVLVLLYVFVELGKRKRSVSLCKVHVGGAWVLGDELLDNLSDDGLPSVGRVFFVGDDAAAYGVVVGVDVEHRTCPLLVQDGLCAYQPAVPFSSTSICLFRGVLSAIVVAANLMPCSTVPRVK